MVRSRLAIKRRELLLHLTISNYIVYVFISNVRIYGSLDLRAAYN